MQVLHCVLLDSESVFLKPAEPGCNIPAGLRVMVFCVTIHLPHIFHCRRAEATLYFRFTNDANGSQVLFYCIEGIRFKPSTLH